METVLRNIKDWFLAKKKYFMKFAEVDTRIEGWFKAELIVLLDKLLQRNVIKQFEREKKYYVSSRRMQIDFVIWINNITHFFELKVLCISQTSTIRSLHFYFRDNEELIKDLRRLDVFKKNLHHALRAESDNLSKKNIWVIGFVYPNPGHDRWVKEIISMPEDLKHWNCITDPSDFYKILDENQDDNPLGLDNTQLQKWSDNLYDISTHMTSKDIIKENQELSAAV